MGLVKDVFKDNKDATFKYRVKELINPREWRRHHRWRKQRANRGWSDRDTWNAGDHIADMTADMLQHLLDKGMTDWPYWFKHNVQEKGAGSYKNLQSVIDDIKNYTDFQWTSWAEGLEPVNDRVFEKLDDDTYEYKLPDWIDKNGKILTEKQLRARMDKWSKEERRLYEKATKAMQFFGRHYSSFWD